MDKKYEILEDTIGAKIMDFSGTHSIYRIRALRDFGNVKAGDIGGYVENYKNLSQKGNCWIHDDAIVCDDAILAYNAHLYDNAFASGKVIIAGHACMKNHARAIGHACLWDGACLSGYAVLCDYATMWGKSIATDSARIDGRSQLRDNVIVSGNTAIMDESLITDNAQICEDGIIKGCMHIGKDAYITSIADCLNIIRIGSEGGNFTAYRCKNGVIRCDRGCFNGTLREFEMAVRKTHGTNTYAEEYMLVLGLVKTRLLFPRPKLVDACGYYHPNVESNFLDYTEY